MFIPTTKNNWVAITIKSHICSALGSPKSSYLKLLKVQSWTIWDDTIKAHCNQAPLKYDVLDVCVRYAFACDTYILRKINDCLYTAKLACISNQYMLRSVCNNRPHKAKGETAIGVLLTATADAWQINQLSLSWSTRSEIRHCYTITTLLAYGIYLNTNNNPNITHVTFWILHY